MIFSWIVLQVVSVISPMLSLPHWVGKLSLASLVAGLPVAIILSWVFDITPRGIERDPVDVLSAKQNPQSETSIAVLPFSDMSAHSNQGYFCDGISEEILYQLSKIRELHVASRTSSFHFRDQSVDAPTIGRQLNVSAVLEGSVKVQDNKLRVSATLINTDNGYQIWSDQYNAKIADIFEVQDKIAANISNALRLSVDPKTKKFMRIGRTESLKAYDFYLKAWDKFYGFTGIHLRQARELFNRAVTIDPDFGRAWAGLAATNAFHCIYSKFSDSMADEARQASEKAIELCPELPESHAARGMSYTIDSDYKKAETHFKKALGIDPGHFESLYFFARVCVHQGDHRRAVKFYGKASEVRRDDYTSLLIGAQSWQALGKEKEYSNWLKQGLKRALQHLENYPGDARAMVLAASSYLDIGEFDKGKSLIESAIRQEPDEGPVLYNAACFFALAGDKDRALDLLRQGAALGIAPRSWVENDEDFKTLRDEAEFKDILATLTD